MFVTLRRGLVTFCSIAFTVTACSDKHDGNAIWVSLDGERFDVTHTTAALWTDDAGRRLVVNAGNHGSDAEDDEEWFTLTVRLAPEALAQGVLAVDGSSLLVDTVDGANRAIPREEDATFEAGADHDPRVLRAWVGHHAWFRRWDGDQSQRIFGQIAIDAIDSDGGLRGALGISVSGQIPPTSWRSDHDLLLIGRFETNP